MRRRVRAAPYLGDEGDGVPAGGGGRGGDGGRVVALGVQETGDRLVGGAGEGVLEVEVELVVVGVLLLRQLPLLRRHDHGSAAPTPAPARGVEREGKPRRAEEHAKKRER